MKLSVNRQRSPSGTVSCSWVSPDNKVRYTTAFWWAAGIFAAGSVLAALLFRPAASAPAAATAAQPEDGALS